MMRNLPDESITQREAADSSTASLPSGVESFFQANARVAGTLLAHVPDAVGVWAQDRRPAYLNRAALALRGVPAGEHAFEQKFEELFAVDDRALIRNVVLPVLARFEEWRGELRFLSTDSGSESIPVHAHVFPIADGMGSFGAVLRDLREKKQAEWRDDLLRQIDDAVRPMTEAHQITQTAARLLGKYLDVNRCAYADVEDDQDTFNLTGDWNRSVPSIVGRYTFAQFGAECLRLMREGNPYVVSDSETDPRTAEVRASYRATLIRSVVCVSLLKAGKFVAAMAVHSAVPRQWRKEEVDLVQTVANRCWEAIERGHVTRELRDSEARLRAAVLGSPHPLMLHAEDGEVLALSRSWTELTGYSPEELRTHQDWYHLAFPGRAEWATRELRQQFASSDVLLAGEVSVTTKSGDERVWSFQTVPLGSLPDGRRLQMSAAVDLTDRTHAEARLLHQWQTFDAVLSNIHDFAYIFDLQGRFLYINRALLALWQKPLEEAVGKNFFELQYPHPLAQRLQAQIAEVIATVRPVRDRTPFAGADGETRHYEYIFTPVLDAEGHVRAVAGSTRDITEQKRAEDLVQEDRRRWRDLLLQAPAAIAILRGSQHEFEWANDNYARLISRPLHSVIGRTVMELLPEFEREKYIALLDHVYRTGEPYIGHESRVRLERVDGSPQDVYCNFIYLATRDAAGEIDGVFVHATDVTDMVVARQRIEESERQFRTLADTIPHLAWVADEHGRIVWFNRRWYEYTGTTFEEMQAAGWESFHHPEALPEILALWKHAVESGQPVETTCPLKRFDKTFRSFLTRVEPVRDNQGRVVRWFGTHTDITDQHETEAELRRMNRELEEFAFVASHDLQEPLRMVNIYTQLILRRLAGADHELSEFAGFVSEGVSRMEMLIHDLLTFSRAVIQSEDLVLDAVDLSAALREALEVLDARIHESQAVIQAGPLPTVRGDAAQFGHVFQNLLANALKYHKPDTPPVIRITSEAKGSEWIISVSDNGIGFDSRYAERIFGLFRRLHKQEYPGTGLGLAICKRIVERFGGRIWAIGEEGQGATFSFALPRLDS